ncbi:hypothetical protein BD779DRAFT_1678770 [Infundibulicybe gibba]|nr:hypothetical protein BD779DRAFT_1678770 [Infundibulicybe gibba]
MSRRSIAASDLWESSVTVRERADDTDETYTIPALLELLRSGEAALEKDTVEYQLRCLLLDILNRLPFVDAVHINVSAIFNRTLHVVRHDDEENGVIACKIMVDIIRSSRTLIEDVPAEFIATPQAFQNMKPLVDEVLAEDSPIFDSNIVLPSIRSFEVIGEMGTVMVVMSQIQRTMFSATIQTTTTPALRSSLQPSRGPERIMRGFSR